MALSERRHFDLDFLTTGNDLQLASNLDMSYKKDKTI
jgi:hypothetical protein